MKTSRPVPVKCCFCTWCGTRLRVKDERHPVNIPCPACKNVFVLPSGQGTTGCEGMEGIPVKVVNLIHLHEKSDNKVLQYLLLVVLSIVLLVGRDENVTRTILQLLGL